MTTGRGSVRVAIAAIAVMIAIGVAAPAIAPHDPAVPSPSADDRWRPPSAEFPLGTDATARDVLSRLVYGTRVSLGTAALATLLVVVVGTAWGAVAGLAPERVDRWMMRFVDAVLATPRLLVVLALVAFLDRMSTVSLAIVLGLTGWPPMSRIVRARVREIAVTDYVAAARALGVPHVRLVARHVVPGAGRAILAGTVLTIASVIPLEAALSFVGAGIAPPTPSWGVLLNDASAQPLAAWWVLVFPAMAIFITVTSVNVLGEWLLDRPAGEAIW